MALYKVTYVGPFVLFNVIAFIFICLIFTFDHLDTTLYGTIIIINNTNSTTRIVPTKWKNDNHTKILPSSDHHDTTIAQLHNASTEPKPIASTNMNQTLLQPIHPATWQHLNKQQFCRIEQSPTQLRFFQFLYHNQFPKNCGATTTKFLIYDIHLEASSGLGASLFGNLLRYFTTALMLNRTFLLHGVFDWSSIVQYCADTNAMECYFLPLSNCDPLHLLSNTNKRDVMEGKGPSDCIFGDNNHKHRLSHCTHKIIYINRRNYDRPVMRKAITKWSKSTFDMDISEYSALITSFLLRPQPIVKDIVLDKIRKAVYKSLNGKVNQLNASKTISLPIRASDKCDNIARVTGKHYTHKPEISCFTPFEYVSVMNAMEYLLPNGSVDSVILTSEDASFVRMVVDIMRNRTYSMVYDWNVIINTEDYSVGEGTTTYQRTQKVYHTVNGEVGTSFYTDHIVSAMSSLLLQLHLDTEYFVVLRSSSWTHLMWKWTPMLNCNIYNPDRHVMRHAKCLALAVPGYEAKYRREKYVVLPNEMCQALRERNVTRDDFFSRFGILIGANHWAKVCQNVCHIR
eukprot:424126_1